MTTGACILSKKIGYLGFGCSVLLKD